MFRTLISFLIPSKFPPEKTPPTLPDMPIPTQLVPGVVDPIPYQGTSQTFVEHVLKRPFKASHLADIDNCVITDIYHYRSDDKNHEIIVAKLTHVPTATIRYLRLERFKAPNSQRQRKDDITSSELISRISSPDDEPTLARDYITIYHEQEKLFDKSYHLARSFSPPPNSFTVLHLAFLAGTIGTLSTEYTKLHHMCLWWASAFFSAAHDICGGPSVPVLRGTAFERMGKFSSLPLVTETGGFTLDFLGQKSTVYVSELVKYLTSQGVANADLEKTKELVTAEIKELQRAGKALSVAAILAAYTAYHKLQRPLIEEMVKEIQDRDDRYATADVALAQKDEVIAQKDEDNARIIAQNAEENARIIAQNAEENERLRLEMAQKDEDNERLRLEMAKMAELLKANGLAT